ncbi:reverse transcriptase domain-containing protein [Tanacetum coccineum]
MIQPWQRIKKQKLTQSFARVSEITFPTLASSDGTEGPLVIEAEIGGHMIHRMYIDGGSSTEVLYEHCFNQLRPEIKSQMVLATTSLTGFSRETIWPLGQLRLLVTIGDADHCTRAWMNFMIVRSMSPYNGIIGRSGIREIQAVPSTAHEMLKFPVNGGIVTIYNTILIPAECAMVITSSKEIPKEAGVRHENFKVAIHSNFPDQEPSDMTGVPRSEAEHRLNIREGYSPIRQKKRGQAPNRAKAIQAEIQMAELDEEKTAFHTSQGVYCYTKMPFGLKNVGATYQRLVDKAFDSQVGRNLEVFLSKSAEKPLLLFKTLKKCIKKRDFHWTSEAEQAFLQLKQHLSELPLLVAPKPKEELIIYLSAFYGAISAVLMTERGMVQTPVYFISRALQGPELKYTPMEKLVLSLVFAAKRLRRYFQAHPITVITDQPIKQIISRPDVAGRLQKWSVMLGEHNITYRPRTSVKGQILADFLVEKPDENPQDTPVVETPPEPWMLFTDGSSCVDGSGAGLILTNPEGTEFTYALQFQFTASNNEAEYEALIAGLRIAAQMGVRNVEVSVDSKLVANQVLGTYVAKEEKMVKYLEKVKSLVSGFAKFSIIQVPQSKNKKADALSKIASTSFAHLSKHVLVEILKEKSIQEEEVATVIEEKETTWMTPITEYLKDGTLPGVRKEASKLRIKARQYELLEGVLYKRSFLKSWLRCVGPFQAKYVIREIHEGSCSMHAGPRSVVAKAMRLGYYWPTMHRDAREMIRTCNDCQIHRPVPRNPQHKLTPITAPWPFYKWGIDIAGPFPEGPGKVKFLIVAMDYFTKWIEAKAVATITGNQVKKFVWDNIVCRFGLPGEIISDNGKQFSDNPFKDWCDKLNITQRFASVKHPQSNGLVERANRSLGEGIKARLGEGNKNWVEELPHVLWAHRTMIKSSHGDTPFSLTYGTEAVIPAEIGMPTYRTAAVDAVHNDEELRLNLDLLEEKRERAAICEAKAKRKMTKYYNARVRGVTFRLGD